MKHKTVHYIISKTAAKRKLLLTPQSAKEVYIFSPQRTNVWPAPIRTSFARRIKRSSARCVTQNVLSASRALRAECVVQASTSKPANASPAQEKTASSALLESSSRSLSANPAFLNAIDAETPVTAANVAKGFILMKQAPA